MTTETNEAIPTLEQIEKAAAFSGFTQDDFGVFEIDGFAARMPQLRAQIKPKLMQIGQILTARLSEIAGEPLHPHVAQHLRRTVNAPVETWVAFSRSPRAYKPFVHLRCGISAEKVRVTVFVEDYADEKLLFADNLRRQANALEHYLALHPTILGYELRDVAGEPKRGHALDAATLRSFADRMHRVKGQHAIFGIAFAKTHPVVQSGPEFLEAVVEAAKTLKPLYDCGHNSD
ncbi:MAG: hypothetical protein JWL77_5307 [Chthonomonadaceae bacterium]|nr:hypothetical protein [Chthonomonadaceae bacterium]